MILQLSKNKMNWYGIAWGHYISGIHTYHIHIVWTCLYLVMEKAIFLRPIFKFFGHDHLGIQPEPTFFKLSKPPAIIFLLWTTMGQKFTKSDLIWACKSWAWGIVCQTKVGMGMPVPITKPVKLIKVLFNYPNPCQTNNYFPSDYSL